MSMHVLSLHLNSTSEHASGSGSGTLSSVDGLQQRQKYKYNAPGRYQFNSRPPCFETRAAETA